MDRGRANDFTDASKATLETLLNAGAASAGPASTIFDNDIAAGYLMGTLLDAERRSEKYSHEWLKSGKIAAARWARANLKHCDEPEKLEYQHDGERFLWKVSFCRGEPTQAEAWMMYNAHKIKEHL